MRHTVYHLCTQHIVHVAMYVTGKYFQCIHYMHIAHSVALETICILRDGIPLWCDTRRQCYIFLNKFTSEAESQMLG